MIRQICTIDMPYINDDIPYMYEDKPYMYEDKPYMHDDKPHMYDDMTYIKDDMTDINDDMTDMYEYHIHVWYHVAWGDYPEENTKKILNCDIQECTRVSMSTIICLKVTLT